MTRAYKGTDPDRPRAMPNRGSQRRAFVSIRWCRMDVERAHRLQEFKGTASCRPVLCFGRSGTGKIGPGLCRRGMIELVAVWKALINRKASIRDT